MATIKQKIAINKTLENIGNKKIEPIGKVMLESGYKPSVAKNPKILTSSKAWDEFLQTIDESVIVNKWKKWALSDSDKRVALQAGENIMKLKGRFKEIIDIGLRKNRDDIIEPD